MVMCYIIFDVQFNQKQFELEDRGKNAQLPKIQSAKVSIADDKNNCEEVNF